MKITPLEITVRDIAKDYVDNQTDGVRGYSGRLDIRPPYQREFVYKEKHRNAVIDTIQHGFPLNVMYWCVREDGDFEIIDGQQRTISFCQFVAGDFSVEKLYMHSLPADKQEAILNYKCMVYLCEGSESDRLNWFRTINIAGVELTQQELRNAVYFGPWLTDAKKYFSWTGCPAYQVGGKYLNGSANRQEYLETAIKWHSGDDIEEYMAQNRHGTSSIELRDYFETVIDWVKATFPTYRSEMKGLPWGEFYAKYQDPSWDSAMADSKVADLMMNSEVQRKKGIYEYLLSNKEKHLNLRQFDPAERREAFERQGGQCAICKGVFTIEEMHADHIVPWHKGGKTEPDNCQMLCAEDNLAKGGN